MITGGDTFLTNLGRQRPDTSLWRTDCKLCRRGIYRGQPAVWLNSPMGLSHAPCVAGPGSTLRAQASAEGQA